MSNSINEKTEKTEIKQKSLNKILKTKTSELTEEERQKKLNYYKKYNNTDKHRSQVKKYYSENAEKIIENNKIYRQKIKQLRALNNNTMSVDMAAILIS